MTDTLGSWVLLIIYFTADGVVGRTSGLRAGSGLARAGDATGTNLGCWVFAVSVIVMTSGQLLYQSIRYREMLPTIAALGLDLLSLTW